MSEPEPLTVHVGFAPPAPRYSLRTGAREAAGDALGLPLPGKVGEGSTAGDRFALCLGPDEWMVCTADNPVTDALDLDEPYSLVDVSDREVAISVSGPGALEALTAVCPRDLSRLSVGNGTRTVMEHVSVVVVRRTKDAFEVHVWRSYAPHLMHLFRTVQAELAVGL
ncbi:MAG: sarcosine oxidase subunit gamma [Pseudomonadota bacterium]